jgi:hypothetical protein
MGKGCSYVWRSFGRAGLSLDKVILGLRAPTEFQYHVDVPRFRKENGIAAEVNVTGLPTADNCCWQSGDDTWAAIYH